METPGELEEQHDEVTGLYNGPAIEQLLAERLASRRAATFPVGCLLVDIDNFSEINDIYGQEVGDEVVRRIAKLVANSCRTEDSVGRHGADEFMLVLPSTGAAGMIVVGERLIRTVSTAYWDDLPSAQEVTISIGGTYLSQGVGISASEMLSIAGSRLAAAKEGGRGGLVISAPSVARY